MNERAVLVVLICLPLFSGRCGAEKHDHDARAVNGEAIVVRGVVHYEERVLLPLGATLLVVAEDVAQSKVLAEDERDISGSPPHRFSNSIAEAAIEDPRDVELHAEIHSSTGHTFASEEPVKAFAGDRPRVEVELLVQPVRD